MELFDRTGIYSIDFIPGLWFKIAQSHLQEQAHDILEGGGGFFLQSRKWRSDKRVGKQFENNRLRIFKGCMERQKLMENLKNWGNDFTGSKFIYGR